MPEPARSRSLRRGDKLANGTVRVIAFFIGVSIVSGLFLALLVVILDALVA